MTAAGRWGPALLWAGAIFAASSQPVPEPVARIPDWLTHGAAYLLLCLLVCRGLAGGFGRRLGVRGAFLAVALSALYGLSDEVHQAFVPGRDASAGDVAKDGAGSLLGAWSFVRRGSAPRTEEA